MLALTVCPMFVKAGKRLQATEDFARCFAATGREHFVPNNSVIHSLEICHGPDGRAGDQTSDTSAPARLARPVTWHRTSTRRPFDTTAGEFRRTCQVAVTSARKPHEFSGPYKFRAQRQVSITVKSRQAADISSLAIPPLIE
ncbi:hypothetical protein MPTK1_3g02410 [Marchantia polymorpha subsp. ruderalis]|uniref:Uncharacterized protein n=2 Tax=Marchantia polymorpha TaxID=3197 RepID=A0AAF6AWP5_MARPO|nr:hypothetical protein MARPO_0007s0230 [Marchantia polymorpha]BBN04179.1 hypothetical protein Mp_3g02410 [Marchantia polymorpha subsp. ruderalis]|eukprot:PTQ47866.1 hypothetical protein MARPO_0007s0230 [Marchantia polymorpha]